MFLFDSAVLGVLVSKYEMQLVVVPALVGPEHDGVGRLVVELAQVRLRVHAAGQQFEVSTAAVLAFLFSKIHHYLIAN